MRSKQRQKLVATIHVLMRRPKWHNEVFARYDQKKLRAWAAEWQRQSLKPFEPRLASRPFSPLSDRMLFREIYKPKIERSQNIGFISV